VLFQWYLFLYCCLKSVGAPRAFCRLLSFQRTVTSEELEELETIPPRKYKNYYFQETPRHSINRTMDHAMASRKRNTVMESQQSSCSEGLASIPENLHVRLIYDDEIFIIINKPPNLRSVPGRAVYGEKPPREKDKGTFSGASTSSRRTG
jgi:23S rRNA-/tRNA-specific pseudouridylate synthase